MYYEGARKGLLLTEKDTDHVIMLFSITDLIEHTEGLQTLLTHADISNCLTDSTEDYATRAYANLNATVQQIRFNSFKRALFKLCVELVLERNDEAKSTFAFILDNYKILYFEGKKEFPEIDKKNIIKEIVYSFTESKLDEFIKLFKEMGLVK